MTFHARVGVFPGSRWAVAAAVVATLGELAAVFASTRSVAGWSPRVVPSESPSERLSFVVTRAAPRVARPPVSVGAPTRAPATRARRVGAPPSVSSSVGSERLDSPPASTSDPAARLRFDAGADRLRAPSTGSGAVSIGPTYGRNPFGPAAALSRGAMDSVLGEMYLAMPALIRARVPTQAERDAEIKEVNLAMRLAGRPLLVPADPHLVPIRRVRVPVLYGGRSRGVRTRDDSAFAENLRRLERLQARAAARRDSVRLADSLSARGAAP